MPFWVEPPSGLTPDQEVERLFEAISQGATGLFDWTGNAISAREVYYTLRADLADLAPAKPATTRTVTINCGAGPIGVTRKRT